jgi:hypothetical protein
MNTEEISTRRKQLTHMAKKELIDFVIEIEQGHKEACDQVRLHKNTIASNEAEFSRLKAHLISRGLPR